MHKSVSYFLPAFMIASLSFGIAPAAAQSKVELAERDGRFQLLRNGKPYAIKGVGGNSYLAALAKSGGNSIRTWNPKGLDTLLDEAHKYGLTVCVGMWLGHERHGFDYQNKAAVEKQFDESLVAVRKYKDHPAMLMWAVGNEMEGEGKNPAVWRAVNDIARAIKRIDPNHPTMTVIAELGENQSKIHGIERYCPDIEIIGINSYGGIGTLGTRYRKAGGSKPYVVTEHGTYGPWETGKTPWGSPFEATSTEKGKAFASGYKAAVAEQSGLCLGSYAFLWGHKQETTATWFGMLLPDGSRLAPVDAMTEAWTGSPPKNECPKIASLKLDRTLGLKPGESIKASVFVSDPESDTLTIKWLLRSDSGTIGSGGDKQESETTIKDAVQAKGSHATVTVPKGGGGYRLFAYAYDGHGGAAVANVPFYVATKLSIPKPPKPSKLPYVVYADDAKDSVFVASGYIGNAGAVKMKADCTDNPHSGKTCLKAEYNSTSSWGGVLWQSPAEDWDGLKPGGANLTDAAHLEFWVRGQNGGEIVNFVFGVLNGNQPYRDTATGKLKAVKLTKEWQKLTFPLEGQDLRRIKTGFGWSLAGQRKPVTFYLDDIRYIGE